MILNYSYEYLHHTHSVLAPYMLRTCSVHAPYTFRTEPLAANPHFYPTNMKGDRLFCFKYGKLVP